MVDFSARGVRKEELGDAVGVEASKGRKNAVQMGPGLLRAQRHVLKGVQDVADEGGGDAARLRELRHQQAHGTLRRVRTGQELLQVLGCGPPKAVVAAGEAHLLRLLILRQVVRAPADEVVGHRLDRPELGLDRLARLFRGAGHEGSRVVLEGHADVWKALRRQNWQLSARVGLQLLRHYPQLQCANQGHGQVPVQGVCLGSHYLWEGFSGAFHVSGHCCSCHLVRDALQAQICVLGGVPDCFRINFHFRIAVILPKLLSFPLI